MILRACEPVAFRQAFARARGEVRGTFSNPAHGRGMKKGLFLPGPSSEAYPPPPDW